MTTNYFLDADKSKKKGNCSRDIKLAKNDKEDLRSPPTTSEEYKLPLVWIDLEMTGRHFPFHV